MLNLACYALRRICCLSWNNLAFHMVMAVSLSLCNNTFAALSQCCHSGISSQSHDLFVKTCLKVEWEEIVWSCGISQCSSWGRLWWQVRVYVLLSPSTLTSDWASHLSLTHNLKRYMSKVTSQPQSTSSSSSLACPTETKTVTQPQDPQSPQHLRK